MTGCPHCGGDPTLTLEEVMLLRKIIRWDTLTPAQKARGQVYYNCLDLNDLGLSIHNGYSPLRVATLELIEQHPKFPADFVRLTSKGFSALGIPAPKRSNP